MSGARLVEGLVTVTGVRDAEPERLDAAVAWASEAWRRWPLESLVGRTIPLAEMGEALAARDADDGLIGVGVGGGPTAR